VEHRRLEEEQPVRRAVGNRVGGLQRFFGHRLAVVAD